MYFSMDIFVNGVSFFSNSTLAWEFILWGTCMVVPNRGFRWEGAHAFCLRFFGASAPQYDTPVISNESERSHAIRSFGRDSSLHYVSFRMTKGF